MTTGRVLIVEADQASAKRLKQTLQKEGYEVLLATTGKEAWDICRRQLPQAVLLDVGLPDLDGYEILRRIRGMLRTRHVHVTFVTPSGERRDKIASLEIGADDYILKPYDVEEVYLKIRNVLRRAKAGSLVDPITGLPGIRLIHEQLRELLRRQDDWALLRVVVRNVDDFTQAQGFIASETVLQTLAQILSAAVDEEDHTDDFIGHNGGDEFIVITSAQRASSLRDSIAHYVQELNRSDLLQDLYIVIDIQTVTTAEGPFRDVVQLTSAFGESPFPRMPASD